MNIGERVAYLKGLAAGMELDAEKKEGKLLLETLDVLGDIAQELTRLQEEQSEMAETLDAVSDDLADVEALFTDDDDDGTAYAATCPACGETVYFDDSALEEGEILCPNCGKMLEFDLDSDDDTPEDE